MTNDTTASTSCGFLVAATHSEQINVFIVALVNLIITISIIITNATVLYIFIVKLKRHKNVSDLLLISLTSWDLVAGLFLHPFTTYAWFVQSTGNYTCGVNLVYVLVVGFILAYISTTTILFITIDVYWGIIKPYSEKWSTKKCFCILATIWILIIITILFSFFLIPKEYSLYIQSISGFIGIMFYVFMSVAHYRLNTEVKKMEENQNSFFHETNAVRKMFKLSTSVLSAVGLCYVPFMIYSIARIIFRDSVVFVYLRPWCFAATLINQLLDPIIYCIRLESIRHEVVKFFFCKNRVATISNGASVL